jgi:hypothetical protein
MIDHVAIQVESIEESINWYTSRFKGIILYQDETWAMLNMGNIKLALTIADQHPPHIAICAKDVSEFPGPLDKIMFHRDGSLYQYTKDPNGNVIEYICYPKT